MFDPNDTIDPSLLLKIGSIIDHSGVKGMKWGVRRSNRRTKKIIAKSGHRNLRKLDEEQIKQVIARMEFDKKYRDLKKAARPEGKDYAIGLLKKTGDEAVKIAAQQATKKIIQKQFGLL